MPPLGHELVGEGAQRVLVLHDWMGDHHNYDPMRPYLDRAAFSHAFADLRGYGLSREREGRYDHLEPAGDVLELADHLGWSRLALVGHSMSSLIAQEVACRAPERVEKLVLITPIAPSGMGAPAEVVAFLERTGADEGARRLVLAQQWGERLSRTWLDFKLRRWAESARPEAARGYVRMFASGAVSGTPRAELPVLAVVGAHDNEPFGEETVRAGLARAYARLQVFVCASSGHYPMQETPAELASELGRFLRA